MVAGDAGVTAEGAMAEGPLIANDVTPPAHQLLGQERDRESVLRSPREDA